MHQLTIMFKCIAVVLAIGHSAFAQQIAVQEPSVETFGVGTTVSAPDRGWVSLGGVSRGQSSRSMFGPLRSGTNIGISRQTGGVSVGVRIHDLDELDRQVLNAAGKGRRPSDRALSPAADQAFETLRTRPGARDDVNAGASAIVTTGPQGTGNPQRQVSPDMPPVTGPPVEKLLDRARQAESAGKRGLALAFLRTARDSGSAEAANEIDRLSKKK